MSNEKLKKVSNKKATKGFISPMAQYLRYGDLNKFDVTEGTLSWDDRGRTRSLADDPKFVTRQDYANKVKELNPNAKAFRFGGKLYEFSSFGRGNWGSKETRT